MINSREFLDLLRRHDLTFFAGVPDSLLKDFCGCLNEQGLEITCANEGNAVALAAGYHLASGRIGVCYFQNAGLGNAFNPLASLAHPEVFSVPQLLLIGWRGEPSTIDEPQHQVQGRVTLPTLDLLGIDYAILSSEPNQAAQQVAEAVAYMNDHSSPYALVVKRGIFAEHDLAVNGNQKNLASREAALGEVILAFGSTTRLIATTGKLSRELFELRTATNQGHASDFLTVGSMGHASSIALGIALQRTDQPVACLDGDGAALMHLGALATIGSQAPTNFHHVLFNNGVHDSVGGQVTSGPEVDFPAVAGACGYHWVGRALTCNEIKDRIEEMLTIPGPTFLDVPVKKGARRDLGRPTCDPKTSKREFMNGLQ